MLPEEVTPLFNAAVLVDKIVLATAEFITEEGGIVILGVVGDDVVVRICVADGVLTKDSVVDVGIFVVILVLVVAGVVIAVLGALVWVVVVTRVVLKLEVLSVPGKPNVSLKMKYGLPPPEPTKISVRPSPEMSGVLVTDWPLPPKPSKRMPAFSILQFAKSTMFPRLRFPQMR